MRAICILHLHASKKKGGFRSGSSAMNRTFRAHLLRRKAAVTTLPQLGLEFREEVARV